MTSLFRLRVWPRVAALFAICSMLYAGTCQHGAHRLNAKSPVEMTALRPASQLEAKRGSAQQPRKEGSASRITDSDSAIQRSAVSGDRVKRSTSSPSLTLPRQRLPTIAEDTIEPYSPKSLQLSAECKIPLCQSISEYSSNQQLHEAPELSAIERLLKRLQSIDINDVEAYGRCLREVAKATSPASATRVQSVLAQEYLRLYGARKGAEAPLVFRGILRSIKTIQADLAHFQRILGKEAPVTSSICFPICGCCEETLKVDLERVDRIKRCYPGMVEAVVQAVQSIED